jgi:hypothetical protein
MAAVRADRQRRAGGRGDGWHCRLGELGIGNERGFEISQRIYLFDTTLRDGQQTPGIDFSVEDKISIAGLLDGFGFDYVEGGYPGANPTDSAFFAKPRTDKASFTAFGMTKRAGRPASNDPGLCSPAAGLGRCGLPGRQELGLPRQGGARLHQ